MKASIASPPGLVSLAGSHGTIAALPPIDGDNQVASSVNLKSGLLAVGALRSDDENSNEPVALETTVVATGARPGDSSAKRELFTEETQTVLVFERGAVIRLSAAVADGQLLFLTNKSTGKEVVTQVVRKRSFRPTNCYVDLEFTDPCPGFWGIEFPKAAVTPTAVGATVAKKLATDEDSGGEPPKSTPPPAARDVERLKQEVSALQNQLKSLMTSNPSGAPAASVGAGLHTGVSPQLAVRAAAEISADLAQKEEERRLQELFALEAKQEDAHNPRILIPNSLKSAESTRKKQGSRTLLNAAGVLLVFGVGTFVAYRLGALNNVLKMAGLTKPAPSHPAAAAAKPPVPTPVAPAATPAATPAPTAAAGSADAASGTAAVPAIAPPTVNAPLLEEKNPATVVDAANVTTWKDNASKPRKSTTPSPPVPGSVIAGSKLRSRTASPAGSSRFSQTQPASDSRVKPDAVVSNLAAATPVTGSAAATAAAVDADGVVAPKLIKGRKSMAPPEMIKNYITGNVNVDAEVDATGHVHSVKVLSGPEKLRAAAIEEMKQYLYQPARKNGKPIATHVQVSMQFWYEP